MTVIDTVLNHLSDIISHMESKEFEINSIQCNGFQETWKQLTPDERREIGRKFAEKVKNHEVDNVKYVSTSSDNHNHYRKI
ncbi:MAG: single-stranded DNA-binding protein [Ruminococcus flavefaciens]|nr:single-stranded DNA-binding protein [Ruminococcus flavefaciens]